MPAKPTLSRAHVVALLRTLRHRSADEDHPLIAALWRAAARDVASAQRVARQQSRLMAQWGRRGGQISSPRTRAAARRNGRKGGRRPTRCTCLDARSRHYYLPTSTACRDCACPAFTPA